VEVIRKTPADCRVPPNLKDYDHARRVFDWSDVPALCEGMGSGGCNIAYAAVDRHVDGPVAARTALRFIADTGAAGDLVTHDISYAELGRLARRFTNVLRSLGVGKGERVFAIMGRIPELYVTVLGGLRPSRSPPASPSVKPGCW
jgi:acetyl-CoA synthetase